MAYQTRDVVEAMSRAAGHEVQDLRVDGGAAVMDLLLQLQADQLGVAVHRPADLETTSRGAVYLAGLAEGVWRSLDDVAASWREEASFSPGDPEAADAGHRRWLEAVGRSRGWIGRADR
jgi:glycerol kinase